MATGLKRIAGPVVAGLGCGLVVFAAETLLILRDGAVGLNMKLGGTFAALLNVVRPQLPLLLLRVAIAYAAAGLLLGLVAAGLTGLLLPAHDRRRRAVVFGEMLALAAFFVWDRAIARPALFDDLPALRAWLAWSMDHGHPWQPRVAATLWIAAHVLVAVRRFQVRRLIPTVLTFAVALVLCCARTTPGLPRAAHPLVVLLGMDAFRPDRIRALGSTETIAPNLEAFLRDATLFERAYTPIAQTEPAWRSLLTARWPHRHGDRYPLTAESRWEMSPTFASEFSKAGYHTTFATDCSRFNYQGPLAGFQERRQPPRGAINFVLEKLRYRGLGIIADNALGAHWLPEFIDNRALAGIHDPLGYVERLADTLVEQARAGPLLFAFHETAAHFPGDPVYPFYRQFVSQSAPLERRTRMSFAPITGPVEHGWTREGTEALYDELLAQADAQIGIVLATLKESGLYDQALIVIFSDHGESFHADAPWLAGATPVHGARLGDEENRILLAIKLPARMRGQTVARVDALVRLIDIGPTLLETQKLPALAGSDGESLLPMLKGQAVPPRRLYAETGFTHARPDAFDLGHLAVAPRSFDAYRIRPDGVVELSDDAHHAILQEKDIGTFDGLRWIIRSPRKDGTIAVRCLGDCSDQRQAMAWLDEVQ